MIANTAVDGQEAESVSAHSEMVLSEQSELVFLKNYTKLSKRQTFDRVSVFSRFTEQFSLNMK